MNDSMNSLEIKLEHFVINPLMYLIHVGIENKEKKGNRVGICYNEKIVGIGYSVARCFNIITAAFLSSM